MTSFLRPSDGAIRQGAYINLNTRGFKAGDRVLFEATLGEPRIDMIDVMDGNAACIDGARILVTKVLGRVPAGTDEAALLARLKAAWAASAPSYVDARRRILKGARVR